MPQASIQLHFLFPLQRINTIFWIIILAASMVLSSCRDSNRYADKQVFRYNESAGISSLDPAVAYNLENMWAVNQLFDGLVELDSNLVPVPLIAKSWSVLDSGRHYRFLLRDDAYFHPSPLFGDSATRKVVASDFVYSFNRIVDPDVASPGQWVFSNIDFDRDGGFVASSDSVFDVFLKTAFPPFLGMMSMQYCNVVPHEVVAHYGPDFRSNPIGAGPFKFAFWLENVSLVYHKHDDYFLHDIEGVQLPYLDAVKIDFVKDMSSEYLGLLKGKFDFMSGIHQAFKDELLDPYGRLNAEYTDVLNFQKTPFIKTDYLGLLVDPTMSLVENGPLMTRKVRQALNYALNRREMTRFLRNNSVYPAENGFIPKGLPSFNESGSYGYKYDLDKAKSLLDEAGHPEGEGIPSITVSTTSEYVDLCEFIQHEWSKIGIDLVIDVLPASAHRESVANSKVAIFRKSWLADYADAENFLGLFYSKNFCPGGPNYTHFQNDQFDALFEEARQEISHQRRIMLYQQMDSLVMFEAPVIPLFYDQVSHFIRKDVSGLVTNPINMLDLKTVRKTGPSKK
jgi:peptide/nickel transport system substrate-binding protein